ncbi:MAG: hypothetical protein ACRD5H_16525 [Nitrososphaerales archaeon]
MRTAVTLAITIGMVSAIAILLILYLVPSASLIIGRFPEKPNNPKLPLQNLDAATLQVNNPGLLLILSDVDRSFDENQSIHTSKRMVVSRAEATLLLNTVPFTYYDPNTIPGGTGYSANIEIDGKYYGIVLVVPKWIFG